MLNFCTLFDSRYLSRGLLMYESLVKHEPGSHLYIVAFDHLALNILSQLNLEKATVIPLHDFENEDLLRVKNSRSIAEYCWTCTSSVIEYVLKKYKVDSCTYVDADLYFYSSARILTEELQNGKTVLITDHRFSRLARLLEQKRAGRFCVQFITFINTPGSRSILRKWIGQCIDWCYSRYEDGKFGDQKYLDSWPEEYPEVHILENHGGGIAPWNARQYDFEIKDGSINGNVKENNIKFEVVFFHYHFVKFSNNNYADLGWNRIPENTIKLFYKPYIRELLNKERFLEKAYPEYKMTLVNGSSSSAREFIKNTYKKISRFNLIKLPSDGPSY
jgi:hypothetical protein